MLPGELKWYLNGQALRLDIIYVCNINKNIIFKHYGFGYPKQGHSNHCAPVSYSTIMVDENNTKTKFTLKALKYVSVSSFCVIEDLNILWIYGHYKYFYSHSAGIDFGRHKRQILTSKYDPRIERGTFILLRFSATWSCGSRYFKWVKSSDINLIWDW